MDQSVIKSLKGRYRRKMLTELIETDGKVSIDMLQAVNFISKAWKEVTAATIQHSFRHAGLCSSQTVEMDQFDSKDNLPLSEWISQFNTPDNFNKDLQSYENIDEDVATTDSLTDEQIVDLVSKSKENRNNDDEEDDQVDEAESPPTIQQALDAAKLIETFLLFNQDDSTTYLDMNRIHKIIQNKYWHSKKHVFEQATQMISGDQYPTSSLIIPIIYGLFDNIQSLGPRVSTTIGAIFLETLKENINDRLLDYKSRTVCRISTTLHPVFRNGFRQLNNKLAGKEAEKGRN
ncbi:hypothetical protein SFRURICE_003917 [Spodoptera frugiperda]|nr:hypothetical protein SFRURICE_003917 [Spodoptera frugiperda]